MDLEKVIKNRRSIRDYSNKDVSTDLVLEAISAANLAPSPGHLQILKFIIVKDSEKIVKIANACQQEFVKSAPIVVVVCSNKSDVEKMYDERADKYLKHHAGAAIENFLLKITDLKLASCWVGAFSELIIKNALNIPNDIEVEAILPVAYASKSIKISEKSKPELINTIFFEEWKNKYQKPVRKIEG
jgi:nitroreductase